MVQKDVALLEPQQALLPLFGDRAFLRNQRSRPELEGDRP